MDATEKAHMISESQKNLPQAETEQPILGSNDSSLNQASILEINKQSEEQLLPLGDSEAQSTRINDKRFKLQDNVNKNVQKKKNNRNLLEEKKGFLDDIIPEQSNNDLPNQLSIPGGEKFSEIENNGNYLLGNDISQIRPLNLKSKQPKKTNANLNKTNNLDNNNIMNSLDSEYLSVNKKQKHASISIGKHHKKQSHKLKQNNILPIENILNNNENVDDMVAPYQVNQVLKSNIHHMKSHNLPSNNKINKPIKSHRKINHKNLLKPLQPKRIIKNKLRQRLLNKRQHVPPSYIKPRRLHTNKKPNPSLVMKSHLQTQKRTHNVIRKPHQHIIQVTNHKKKQVINKYHNNRREILNLEKRINSLMKMNEKLLGQIRSSSVLKKQKTNLKNQIVSFIQKVENLEDNNEVNKKVEHKIINKYKKIKQKFEDLEYKLSENEEMRENEDLEY